MLFDLIVKIKAPGHRPASPKEAELFMKTTAPGRDKEGAFKWLKDQVYYLDFELIEAKPSEKQPAPITGSGSITMPLNVVKGTG